MEIACWGKLVHNFLITCSTTRLKRKPLPFVPNTIFPIDIDHNWLWRLRETGRLQNDDVMELSGFQMRKIKNLNMAYGSEGPVDAFPQGTLGFFDTVGNVWQVDVNVFWKGQQSLILWFSSLSFNHQFPLYKWLILQSVRDAVVWRLVFCLTWRAWHTPSVWWLQHALLWWTTQHHHGWVVHEHWRRS